jgi:hypothetical protein
LAALRWEEAKRELEEMKRQDAEERRQKRWQREEEAMKGAMKAWLEWLIETPNPVEQCSSECLRGSIRELRTWLKNFEKFEGPEAIQFEQDIEDVVIRGEKRLKVEEEKEKEEYRIRKAEKEKLKAMKAREEEESRRGKNTKK